MADLRTLDEQRIDAALLLALWSRAAPAGSDDLGDRLRLMKLAYLGARSCAERRARGLSTSFYRWRWGPLSNEVYHAWEQLAAARLLQDDEHIVLTEDGASLADDFYDEVLRSEENASIRAALDEVAERWRAQPSTGAIMDYVYSLPARSGAGNGETISSTALGAGLLKPLSARAAQSTISVDPGWLETLALLFNAPARARLREAEADFRAGRFQVA